MATAPAVAPPASTQVAAPPEPVGAIEPEAILVHQAVQALRNQHDAPRAVSLLEQYLRRFPDGAIAEEALALQIEARVAQDDARAAALAARYLDRFPSGRYRVAAEHALHRFAR